MFPFICYTVKTLCARKKKKKEKNLASKSQINKKTRHTFLKRSMWSQLPEKRLVHCLLNHFLRLELETWSFRMNIQPGEQSREKLPFLARFSGPNPGKTHNSSAVSVQRVLAWTSYVSAWAFVKLATFKQTVQTRKLQKIPKHEVQQVKMFLFFLN